MLRAGTEPGENYSPGPKRPHKLGKGDWRGLLKATESSISRVFGPLEDQGELAAAIRKFAQGIADLYARPRGKIVVSVSVEGGR